MNNEELLSYKEAANLFKRGRTWLYALRILGLPTYGGRIRKGEMIEFVQKHPTPEYELKKRMEKKKRRQRLKK